MDFGSITGAMNSIKAVSDVAQSLIGLHAKAEVQAKAIELNQKIIEAQNSIFSVQAAQTALINRVRELEGEVTSMKNWETQKQRYELAAPFPGCMVYALKRSMSNGQTPHYLCAACFQKSQTSILQGKEESHMQSLVYAEYCCPVCKSKAQTNWMNIEPPKYFEDIVPKQELRS